MSAVAKKSVVKKTAAKKTVVKKSAVKKITTKTALNDKKNLTAKEFIIRLKAMQSDEELKKILRYFKEGNTKDDKFIGVRMGSVFALAKEFINMIPAEIELLLESPIHEVRAGAMSIMDKQGRSNKTTEIRRKELFDLYIRRHDRINNWDLVDLAAIYVVGRYLDDKPRGILYKLAKSKNKWERRTAIFSTCYFIRKGDMDDTYKLAGILLHDAEDPVNKATGWMLRVADGKDRKRLIAFLDKYASTMPRITLRNALEHFDKKLRDYYLGLKENNPAKAQPEKK